MEDPGGYAPKRCSQMKPASWYAGTIGRRMQTASGCGNPIIEPTPFLEKVKADLENFDWNNTYEKNVLKSNFFSAYKGKFVIRTDGKRSGSLGVLFITRETNSRDYPEDMVRHEYGHTKQLDQLGLVKYLLCIGMPSAFEWGSDPKYYRRPWEITEDIYGGVESRCYPGYDIVGIEYLTYSKKLGPLVWVTIQ